MDKQAEVFKLSIPEADIVDLRERLERTRLQDRRLIPALGVRHRRPMDPGVGRLLAE